MIQLFRPVLVIMFASILFPVSRDAWAGETDSGAVGKQGASPLKELNGKALGQLRGKHYDAAKDVLLEALVFAKENGLEGTQELAHTYVYLASIYLNGEKNRDKGVRQLALALQIDPDVTAPSEIDTPAMRSALLLARRQAGTTTSQPSAEKQPVPVAPPPSKVEPAGAPAMPPSPAASPESGDTATISRRGRGGHMMQIKVADPDLPAKVNTPLYCPLPFEIPPAQDLVVRCLTQKQQKKSTAKLYYRPEGSTGEDFLVLDMNRSAKGWLQATLPADAIKGKSLAYYIEARVPGQAGNEAQVLYLAHSDSPNTFLIREGADASMVPEEENILATLNTSIADEDDTFHYHRRGPGAIWVSLAGGTGAAYHGTEAVDSGDTYNGSAIRSLSGLTKAGLLQTELEIGYQFTKKLSVSVMGRYQYAPPDSSGYTGKAILSSALAGYARARYALLTLGNFQGLVSGGLGGGNNFLVIVDKQCDANNPTTGCKLTHSDTLHGGPLGVLLGLGAAYHITRSLAVFVDVNEIASFGKFMALTEVNLGIAGAYTLDGSAKPTADEGVAAEKPIENTPEPGNEEPTEEAP